MRYLNVREKIVKVKILIFFVYLLQKIIKAALGRILGILQISSCSNTRINIHNSNQDS